MGKELTVYQFTAADETGVTQKPDDPNPVELNVKATSAGITPVLENYAFSLTI